MNIHFRFFYRGIQVILLLSYAKFFVAQENKLADFIADFSLYPRIYLHFIKIIIIIQM